MRNFAADKRWSDRFLPEIKRILGEHLIDEAPFEEDAQHNTDLMVLRLKLIRIGCRVRRAKYHAQYADEFTIRSDRPSGAETELSKVVDGWGDYFFYGFSDSAETDLQDWMLGDLDVFRDWFDYEESPCREKNNEDGSSMFRAFKKSELPANFMVAQKNITRTTKKSKKKRYKKGMLFHSFGGKRYSEDGVEFDWTA